MAETDGEEAPVGRRREPGDEGDAALIVSLRTRIEDDIALAHRLGRAEDAGTDTAARLLCAEPAAGDVPRKIEREEISDGVAGDPIAKAFDAWDARDVRVGELRLRA